MNWHWFLAVAHNGWIITEGVSNINFHDNKFIAELFFCDSDEHPYLTIKGLIDQNERVEAICIPFDSDVPRYDVFGVYHSNSYIDGDTKTFSLLDGSTMIGLSIKV